MDYVRPVWVVLLLLRNYGHSAVQMLSQEPCINHVTDAFASSGVGLGLILSRTELLLEILYSRLHVSFLVDTVLMVQFVCKYLGLRSPTSNIRLHEVAGSAVSSYKQLV